MINKHKNKQFNISKGKENINKINKIVKKFQNNQELISKLIKINNKIMRYKK